MVTHILLTLLKLAKVEIRKKITIGIIATSLAHVTTAMLLTACTARITAFLPAVITSLLLSLMERIQEALALHM